MLAITSGSSVAPSGCTVCNNGRHVEYSYGGLVCNACKMFYRRWAPKSHELGKCTQKLTPKLCYTKHSPIRSKCKSCRFEKCLSVGMRGEPNFQIDRVKMEKTFDMEKLISSLSDLNLRRRDILENYCVDLNLNPTFDQLINRSCSVSFTPKNGAMDWGKWAFFCSIVSIEFLTHFDFMRQLNSDDQRIVLKASFIGNSLLENAASTFFSMPGVKTIRFPDGSEIMPDILPGPNPELVDEIKTMLMVKLRDVQITYEEYILLCPVIVCNPGLSELSANGRVQLANFRNVYSSHLLHHCLHRTGGPSRFHDLLSIEQVIMSTLKKIEDYSYLMKFYQPHRVVKKLIDVHS